MTTVPGRAATNAGTVRSADPSPRGSVSADPSTRGKLTIAEKAIEKIAAHVASEVPGISGSTGGFLGIGSRGEHAPRPQATVRLSGLIATLSISAGIRYPAPLRTTTERLRQHVRDEVSTRCGVEVRQVDIDVVELINPSHSTGRRELL
ncbi:Asp23/Gls24 family envelope stress response protein [Arthrobacter sp. Br18]|uniref:Asp23/Gls24 family envelope stress response protein n=1 Tax=Arthrobacter sp. Br18 TaxID=1312954 RepID=UPI0004B227A6|nr:Asp23/Gls24 family envelope stress response protein [Arthrobacter sp. Br18]